MSLEHGTCLWSMEHVSGAWNTSLEHGTRLWNTEHVSGAWNMEHVSGAWSMPLEHGTHLWSMEHNCGTCNTSEGTCVPQTLKSDSLLASYKTMQEGIFETYYSLGL